MCCTCNLDLHRRRSIRNALPESARDEYFPTISPRFRLQRIRFDRNFPILLSFFFSISKGCVNRSNELINQFDLCAITRINIYTYVYIFIPRILPDRTGTIRARFRSTVKDNEPWNNNFFPPLSSPFPITLVS